MFVTAPWGAECNGNVSCRISHVHVALLRSWFRSSVQERRTTYNNTIHVTPGQVVIHLVSKVQQSSSAYCINMEHDLVIRAGDLPEL